MDLLGGGESSSEDEQSSEILPKSKVSPMKDTVRVSRAKKIISLQNVLPQHILERLTRSEVQGDSSDEEEDVGRKPSVKSNSSVAAGDDKKMQSFLLELKSTPSSTQPYPDVTREQRKSPIDKLGDAFLTTTTTVVKKANLPVRDIHAETPSVGTHENTHHAAKRTKSVLPISAIRRANIVPLVKDRESSAIQDKQEASIATVSTDCSQLAPASRKRSRKEIEKALRAGNLALEDQESHQLQQAVPQYQPQENTYSVPVDGVKVASTTMYDPSSGAAVGGRGGGKNQINQLMRQAASLELDRARGLDGSGSQKGKLQRANAKRKYGW